LHEPPRTYKKGLWHYGSRDSLLQHLSLHAEEGGISRVSSALDQGKRVELGGYITSLG